MIIFSALPMLDLLVQAPLLSSVWIFVVGGCVGSFMNVVVYRLPAGLSLVHPPSHCPTCGHPIRARDNLPILGWILLRGRCRDCQTAIPPRYAIVEAVVAMAFLLIWLSDVALLPFPVATMVRLGEFGLHITLSCTLICAALIDVDGQVMPWRLVTPAVIALLVAAIFAPYLLYHLQSQQPEMQPWLGMAAGAVAGATFAGLACRRSEPTWSQRAALAVGILTGVYLSWYAVSVIVIVSSGIVVLGRRARQRVWGRWTMVFAAVTPFYLMVDALLANWRGPPISLMARLSVLSIALLLVLISRSPLSTQRTKLARESR